MIAHIRKSDKAEQRLGAHCRAASEFARRSLQPIGLGATGALAGLLHDMGKATAAFQAYLREPAAHPDRKPADSPAHAPIGAAFACEQWFNGDEGRKRTAQIVSMAVFGHHAGLPDCLDIHGKSPYLLHFDPAGREKLHYSEAVDNYLREVAGSDELNLLFERVCGEMRAAEEKLDSDAGERAFQLGMLARTVLSAVVDADRWDSARFERGDDSAEPDAPLPDWSALLKKLEAHLGSLPRRNAIDDLRADISMQCLRCGRLSPGIFALTVPTGGGKTFSTLRFSLEHILSNEMRRVFYVIPFNTILDQNADDIREALDQYDGILEHHSGVVWDDEEDESEYRRLTERWDMDIVFTSMVQFLNALFRKENTDARRMRALMHSVLIFDEVQALPKKCTGLFEKAIRFLVRFYGCTVVLCTATQPRFELPAVEMIGDVPRLFSDMHRVRRIHYVDRSRAAISNAEAAEKIVELMDRHGSVLLVVNTKPVARAVYSLAKKALAGKAATFHLSTNMCAAHRLDILAEVKARTGSGSRKPTLLISTQLIEAGINVSFPAVVRSLAGLSSINQAAGRCNRNAEDELGTVYLWKLSEEKLTSLAEILAERELADAYLRHFEDQIDRIGDPDVLALYFGDERREFSGALSYPHIDWNTNLCEMLSENGKCKGAAEEAHTGMSQKLCLKQSFRKAGETFEVIDQKTRPVVVPYGEGKEIIAALFGAHDMKEEIRLMRRAQRFSVNVYEHEYRALEDRHALYPVGETGIVALREEFYSAEIGLVLDPAGMELLNI